MFDQVKSPQLYWTGLGLLVVGAVLLHDQPLQIWAAWLLAYWGGVAIRSARA